MKFMLLIVSLLLCSFAIFAEENTADSMLKNMEVNVSVQPMILPELIKEFKKLNFELTRDQKARLLIVESHLKVLSSDYEAALILIKKAEMERPSYFTLSNIYHYMSVVYLNRGSYDEALKIIAKNLSRVEQIEDTGVKLKSYLRIANVFMQLEAYSDSLKYSLIAKEMSKDTDQHNYCSSLLLIAVNQLKLNILDESRQHFVQAKQICLQAKHNIIVAMAIKGLAYIEFELKNYKQAEQLLWEAHDAYQPFQYKTELINIDAKLAEVYFAEGNLELSQLHANNVLNSEHEQQLDMDSSEIAHSVLAKIASHKQNFQDAYQHLKQSNTLKERRLDDTKARSHAYQTAKFNSVEKEREIALLNKDRELYLSMQQTKDHEHANMLLFTTILVGGVFFLTILVVVSLSQKRKFMRLAKMDALTGIYNRGAGQDMGEDSLVHVLSRQGDFCVILFDMDHFKSINDHYGHATGDWVLKKVAEVLKAHIRSSDIFARVGGEEFAIMLPYADESKAMDVAEVCRQTIQDIDTKYSGHVFSISASFGVARLTRNDLSLDPILYRADVALYQAKERGRNQVSLYREQMEGADGAAAYQSKLALN